MLFELFVVDEELGVVVMRRLFACPEELFMRM